MMDTLPILQQFARFQMTESEALALQPELDKISNWPAFVEQIELYALSGFFLQHVKQHKLVIDQSVLLSLKALSLRHKSAAQARYETLALVQSAFAKADIPVVLLKGLALMPMLYGDEALRPMRDMDVLVPKPQLHQAAQILREQEFDLPREQPSKFMRGSHQLPNATKRVNGFLMSVEVHHNALSQDVRGSLDYTDIAANTQVVQWKSLSLLTLSHILMLHQLCRHLEGVHPGSVLKLINVMDVVGYAEMYIEQIDWSVVQRDYSHIINTLKCLHLITPLSEALQNRIGGVSAASPNGVGRIMAPLTTIFSSRYNVKQRYQMLFLPSDWWLHLYYNVDPVKSLWPIKLIRHPLTISWWLLQRLYSRLLGG